MRTLRCSTRPRKKTGIVNRSSCLKGIAPAQPRLFAKTVERHVIVIVGMTSQNNSGPDFEKTDRHGTRPADARCSGTGPPNSGSKCSNGKLDFFHAAGGRPVSREARLDNLGLVEAVDCAQRKCQCCLSDPRRLGAIPLCCGRKARLAMERWSGLDAMSRWPECRCQSDTTNLAQARSYMLNSSLIYLPEH